jgi:hypothetical protein
MPKAKRYPRAALARMTDSERKELHRRARAANLSLSRYLVEAGLAPASLPSARDREQRDRALFHLRKSTTNLDQIARSLSRAGGVPRTLLEEALRAHSRAADVILEAYQRRSQ